jgi:hypothetical protein
VVSRLADKSETASCRWHSYPKREKLVSLGGIRYCPHLQCGTPDCAIAEASATGCAIGDAARQQPRVDHPFTPETHRNYLTKMPSLLSASGIATISGDIAINLSSPHSAAKNACVMHRPMRSAT